MTTINLKTEIQVLKGYINYFISHKDYSREQLYNDYYNGDYQEQMKARTLDKYIERAMAS